MEPHDYDTDIDSSDELSTHVDASTNLPPTLHSTPFTFPQLSPDGSVESLLTRKRPPYRTPPAALSTAGVKASMAAMENNDAASAASFSDNQYDVIDYDDFSETSNDDRETASIVSSDDDGQITPEGTEPARSDSPFVKVSSDGEEVRDEQPALLEPSASFLSEDMETPRQSTLAAMSQFQSTQPSKAVNVSTQTSTSPSTWTLSQFKQPAWLPKWTVKRPDWNVDDALPQIKRIANQLACFAMQHKPHVIAALIAFLLLSVTSSIFIVDTPVTAVMTRRGALMTATSKQNPEIAKIIDVNHLLPTPVVGKSFFGRSTYAEQEIIHYQGLPPNHFVVSLPKKSGSFTKPKSIHVYRGDSKLAHNATKVIDGIYDITIDPAQAYGLVNVQVVTTNPLNSTIQHNFGSRILQKQTYEKAGEELTKELTVAAHMMSSLKDNLQLEINAGVSATRNITSQLASNSLRGLQSCVQATANMFSKASQSSANLVVQASEASVNTTSSLVRRLFTLHKDHEHLGKKVKHIIKKVALARSRIIRLRKLIRHIKWRREHHRTPASIKAQLKARAHELSEHLREIPSKIQSTIDRLFRKAHEKPAGVALHKLAKMRKAAKKAKATKVPTLTGKLLLPTEKACKSGLSKVGGEKKCAKKTSVLQKMKM